MNENVPIAFALTVLAGLSTGIGSLLALFIKDEQRRFLNFAMGLAAGVMIYLSFMEMLPHAIAKLSAHHPAHDGHDHSHSWAAIIAFFAGMGLVELIDRLLPHYHHHHNIVPAEHPHHPQKDRLLRVGLMTTVGLAIHNFPEGIATFLSAIEDPHLGFTIAIAIALHNIPEGIGVALPIYHATGNRKKAFFYSFLSGLVEPVGALVGYALLLPFLTPFVMGTLMAAVAGIMVYIALDQLLPAAQTSDHPKLSIYGAVTGMLLMAISMGMLVGHHSH